MIKVFVDYAPPVASPLCPRRAGIFARWARSPRGVSNGWGFAPTPHQRVCDSLDSLCFGANFVKRALSFAKDGGANAYAGGAFGNGFFKVAAHAHGEEGQGVGTALA